VPSGRANFRPRRWWSSRCVTQMAFACMTREDVFMPWMGPIGALGISSETTADLGKERRTTTKAPPGEMLTAVANSRQSLPAPSRARTKTGMASCSRAHLRSSFFDMLRDTVRPTPKPVFTPLEPHLMGQTQEETWFGWNRPKPSLQHGDHVSVFQAREFDHDLRSDQECNVFRIGVTGRFAIDSLL